MIRFCTYSQLLKILAPIKELLIENEMDGQLIESDALRGMEMSLGLGLGLG